MPHARLITRLTALEARRPAAVDIPDHPSDFSPDFWEQVYTILYNVGYRETTLRASGATEAELSVITAYLEEHVSDALIP